MEILGILKTKGVEQKLSAKFSKLEFVITDNNPKYPQHISFQLTNDRCDLLDKYKVGDQINVHFNLRGREWTSPSGETKYFNTLEAWKIEGLDIDDTDSHETQSQNDYPTQNDLPFN